VGRKNARVVVVVVVVVVVLVVILVVVAAAAAAVAAAVLIWSRRGRLRGLRCHSSVVSGKRKSRRKSRRRARSPLRPLQCEGKKGGDRGRSGERRRGLDGNRHHR
jgi:Flp pilus assembly protein TadB